MAELVLDDLLTSAYKVGASDIHLKADSPPVLRVDGNLIFIKDAPKVSNDDMKRLAYSLMSDLQRENFEKNNELDLAYSLPDISRFRINVYQQRGSLAMALRSLPFEIRNFKQLNLPPVVEEIAEEERGLIVVTGTTSSGKSTTLAALIDHINRTRARHIITIEDPLEYVHDDKKSFISQREVSIDTFAFANALRAALREDPDVILVGEMRDLETMEIAFEAAETGHLVLTTLHTLDAQETVNRVLTVFPPHQHNQVRYQLAQVLKAVISQRLMPMAGGKGRVPAAEVLIATSRIKELILEPEKTREIRMAIEEGYLHYGMQTFDQCIYDLYKKDLITYDEAMRQATNKDDLALRIRGITSGSASLSRMETERGAAR
ncbi:type IV pilus twitching motility protein PilT [Desulfobacterota bacterium AH_259_B03_O07]|nr:type IV pilus twitching motility protein PilT [Desulfobacterota bacterium AH_259_B03_O07]